MPQDWFAANAPTKAASEDWFASNAPKKETPPPSKPPAPLHPNARIGQPVLNLAKGVLNRVSAIPGALYDMAADVAPYDAYGNPKMPMGNTVSALVDASRETAGGAIEAWKKGDYLTSIRKAIHSGLPVVGPAIDASTDKMMRGDVAEGAGEVLFDAVTTMMPFAPRSTAARGPILKPKLNPKEAAAIEFGQRRGVPIDVGTATGSNFIKTVQEKAANTYGGARTAEAMQGRQMEALSRVSGDLAKEAAPKPTTPVAAGERVRGVLTKQIQDLHARATAAYDALRQHEQSATPDMVNQYGAKGADAFQDMQLAVDLRANKTAMRPILDRLNKKKELTGQLMGAEARAAVALDSLINGPDFAPLSVADAALSDIKALARGADMPELRSTGQGMAAEAVRHLDASIRARASRAGADVLKALEDGRAATKQKYATADVLDMLNGEPGQVFRQLTQNKDIGLERLRAVQRLAPKELPNIGRAFLEDLFQQATNEGGWAHADKLWADWNRLGSETKQALYPKKGQIEALDNFFLLQKRMKEVKNPSGTARMMTATNLLAGIPGWAVAKMLMTPEGAKWLTTTRVTGKSPSPAARALAVTNLTKAAQSAGVPLDAIPALGEEQSPPMPLGTRR